MVKKRVNFTFSEAFYGALQEFVYSRIVQIPGVDGRPSVSAYLESYFTNVLIYQDLKTRNFPKYKLQAVCNNPKKICQLWLAVKKAEAGEPGYKIHQNPKVGIIGIEIPDPNNPGSKIML